jgi:hypothetical protein
VYLEIALVRVAFLGACNTGLEPEICTMHVTKNLVDSSTCRPRCMLVAASGMTCTTSVGALQAAQMRWATPLASASSCSGICGGRIILPNLCKFVTPLGFDKYQDRICRSHGILVAPGVLASDLWGWEPAGLRPVVAPKPQDLHA